MTGVKQAVVIATCRQDSMQRWLDAWRPELRETAIYMIEDSFSPVMELNITGYTNFRRWSWSGIDRILGENSWIIPRRTSAIKSFGFLKAHQDGYTHIWTLDDDCYPEDDREYPTGQLMQLSLRESAAIEDPSWWNTITPTGLYPRGYPYGIRQKTSPVMIHHGLWSGVPDLDGITALEYADFRTEPATTAQVVPRGAFFPMCGMNLAFRREMVPAMYFGLQGHERDATYDQYSFSRVPGAISRVPGTSPLPFDRFDDIWAGLFAKKVCDHLGYTVTSGSPSILHTRESDPTMRVIKEGPGIAAHEILWRKVADHAIAPGLNTVGGSYCDLAGLVESIADDLPYPDYWRKLAKAMRIWTEQF